ncbi:MAG: hypothetical protein ACI8W9_001019, partial [Psychromonas sp.]
TKNDKRWGHTSLVINKPNQCGYENFCAFFLAEK